MSETASGSQLDRLVSVVVFQHFSGRLIFTEMHLYSLCWRLSVF
ncbi:hypothetical protein SynBIOSU31_01986 [Synechococcus sp. BIOS-U3-1]|nr:hypothetical protein SynBIOSU31_01986 [Synechococcus sp. BIOS-U3-1]